MAKMPQQKPHKSKQDYGTPPELLQAVKNRLCIKEFDIDVAASKENAICPYYYSLEEGRDAFANSWSVEEPDSGWVWCNPPYADIGPWVANAIAESAVGAQVVMLVPASVGSNWWKECVEPFAYVVYLNGRLQFVGAEGLYPKDCALLFYTPWGFKGSEIWTWRADVPQLFKQQPSEDKGLRPVLDLSL